MIILSFAGVALLGGIAGYGVHHGSGWIVGFCVGAAFALGRGV